MGFLSSPFLVLELTRQKHTLEKQKREIHRHRMDLATLSSIFYNINNPLMQTSTTGVSSWGRTIKNAINKELSSFVAQVNEDFTNGAPWQKAQEKAQEQVAISQNRRWTELSQQEQTDLLPIVTEMATKMVQQEKDQALQSAQQDFANRQVQQIANIENLLIEKKENIDSQMAYIEGRITEERAKGQKDTQALFQNYYTA